MRKIFIIIIFITFLIFYLIIVNILANYRFSFFDPSATQQTQQISYSGDVVLNFGENVDVTVRRNRWYGTIIENIGSSKKLSNLYLFRFIKIPIKVNNSNWIFRHLFVFCLYSLIFFIVMKGGKNKKWRKKANGNTFGSLLEGY